MTSNHLGQSSPRQGVKEQGAGLVFSEPEFNPNIKGHRM